jgi:endonuclease/exonuclease/phosphatase family metal-dependent hydrolase
MRSPLIVLAASVVLLSVGVQAQQAPTYKVAFYNIKSGMGQVPLAGRSVSFAETYNCTDPAQPLNAWGVGLVQAELRAKIANDPQVIALGLGEAWLCGTPASVAKVLGWTARSEQRNGVALLARHGFAAPQQWLQLDTSVNLNPADTKWVVRVPVCVDAPCSQSIPVFAAHWRADGDQWIATYDKQARATLDFMSREGNRPHLLIGDLNIYEGTATSCTPLPNNVVLPLLRGAGYVDAWPAIHGTADGYTGMANRNGCGVPAGYAFKRIDRAWLKGFSVTSMSRFGMAPPGEASLSDHYGITVAISDALAPPPPPSDRREIVLRSSSVVTLAGLWRGEADNSAAERRRIRHPDAGAPKLTAVLAAPTNYVEVTFDVDAGRWYRIWIRGRADRDSYSNDSVFLQFSATVTATGAPIYRIGSTSATTVVVEDCAGCGLSAWGWQDNAYGLGALGPLVRFEVSGRQRLRIQTREDGVAIDQIVLSSERYLKSAPGLTRQDTTILP